MLLEAAAMIHCGAIARHRRPSRRPLRLLAGRTRPCAQRYVEDDATYEHHGLRKFGAAGARLRGFPLLPIQQLRRDDRLTGPADSITAVFSLRIEERPHHVVWLVGTVGGGIEVDSRLNRTLEVELIPPPKQCFLVADRHRPPG